MSSEHTQVLSKGLTFAPTHQSNDFQTRIDLFRFYRNLHLKAWYYNRNNTHPVISVTPLEGENATATSFKSKSKFSPTVTNPALVTFTKKVDYEVNKLFEEKILVHKQNLTYKERTALSELSANSDIIIRPADKGGAVVVLSKDKYIKEAHRQLNTRHYERIYSNPLPEMKRQFDILIKEAYELGTINDNEFGFLTVEHPVVAAFYFLPKVHKEPKDNPPGRPIVSGNGTLTEPATKYIDHFIKPLVRKLPSFIEDTTDVLNRIAALTNIKDHFLVTMDVESLYTNIEHQQGLSALQKSLCESDIPKNTCDFLLKLTEWVIHNNLSLWMNYIFKK